MSYINKDDKQRTKPEDFVVQRTPDINIPVSTKKKFNTIVEACKKAGLDGFDYIYEFFHWDEISELAAYGGFPVRYPHYLFGMEFEHINQSYKYGYSKIYEMVINNCIDINSRVATTGGLVKIKDICQNGEIFYDGKKYKSSKVFLKGKKKALKITFDDGREICITPDHELVNHKFEDIKAMNLNCGDYILSPKRNHNFDCNLDFSNYNKWKRKKGKGGHNFKSFDIPDSKSNFIAEFLGILSGDGTYSHDRIVEISVGLDNENYKDYIVNLLSKFKITPKIDKGLHGYNIKIFIKQFRVFLKDCLNLENEKVENKTVPESVFRMSSEQQCYYIRGFFDTDGHCNGKLISMSNISENILRNIQLILMNLKIRSKIFKVNNNHNNIWVLSVVDPDSRIRFRELIGSSSNKFEKLDKLKKSKYGSGFSTVPVELIDKIIAKLNKKSGKGHHYIRTNKQFNLINQIEIALRDSKNEKCNLNEEIELLSNYWFSKIDKIEELPNKIEVADIEVKKANHFEANGLMIHNSPCYAYLLNSNSEIDNLTVIAHAYAHNDFFKNNDWFRTSNRNMINETANHGTKIRRYCQKYGRDKVIKFLDLALSIQYLIDPDDVFQENEYKEISFEDEIITEEPRRIRTSDKHEYMDDFVNPSDFIEGERERIQKEFNKKMRLFPEKSTRDVLGFVATHSPRLRNWMRDILFIIKKESLYFIPQIQCVTGDTLVSTKNGLMEIKDLILKDGYNKEEKDILSINDKFEKTSHLYKKETQNTIKIRTKSGLEIEGTPEHPIQILDKDLNFKMTRLDKLKKGNFTVVKIDQNNSFNQNSFMIDFDLEKKKLSKQKYVECKICGKKVENMVFHLDCHSVKTHTYREKYDNPKIISEYDLYKRSKDFKYPKYMNENIARLFGYYITEGSWSNTSFVISNKDESVLNDIVDIYKKEFELKITSFIDKNECSTLSISNRKFFDFLFSCGLNRDTSYNKEIPISILRSSKNTIRNFLSAFFEGDGCNTKNGSIQCGSMSKKLINQIQHLLFNFGIISKIREEKVNYEYKDKIERKCYRLVVLQYHYNKFLNEIGFRTDRKNKNNYTCNPTNSGGYVFPYIKEHLNNLKNNGKNGKYNIEGKSIQTNIPYTRSKHFGIIDIEKQNNFENICLLNKELGEKIFKVIKKENYYDEIVEITVLNEKKYVYDLTIPSNHLFIANNFVSHNTKICNEGWASYWDEQIMAKGGFAGDAGIIDYADHHSRVMGGKYSRNPYATGNLLLRYIKEKWDKGRFGPEWDECKNAQERREWDLKLGLGTEKLFEIRRRYNDYMLIDEFMDQDFCDEFEYYKWGKNKKGEHVLESRDVADIKPEILKSVGIQRFPIIKVKDANCLNLGHLHLEHTWTNQTLSFKYAQEVVCFLTRLWGRPVVLGTYDIHQSYDSKIPMEFNDKIAPIVIYSLDGMEANKGTWQEYKEEFFPPDPEEMPEGN